ncbi:MAG: hypothetical protein P8Y97_23340 [Candidatus Lokiarchaeota archaeon]
MKYTLYFGAPIFIAYIPVIIGMLFASINLILKILFFGGWIAYSIFFFAIWESRMICNHCPYYANNEERVLHCPTDRGKPKTGKYSPGPLNLSEKIQFIIGAVILMGFPIPFLILASQFVPMLLYGIGVVVWVILIQLKVCTDCLNFSCPLNRVPKRVKNDFIIRNPVIKKAWEEAGYKINSE